MANRRDDYDDRNGPPPHGDDGPRAGETRQRQEQREPEPRCEIIDPRKYRLPPEPLVDIGAANAALNEAIRTGFNVMVPLTGIQHVPRNYAIAIRVIQFSMDGPWLSGFGNSRRSDPEPTQSKCSNGTWYKTDDGKFALHKAPLIMYAGAAGVKDITTVRLPPFEPNYWYVTATVKARTMDGQWAPRDGSKEVDLRDGSSTISGWSQARVTNARANGAANAESKAILRAIRLALGMESVSEDNAYKPFVFTVLVYEAPDDPAVRLLQAATEMGVIDQVFGPGSGAMTRLLAPAGTVIDATHGEPDPEPTPPPRQQEPQRKAIPQDAPRQETPPQRERQREPVRKQSRREEPPPPDDPYGWAPGEDD